MSIVADKFFSDLSEGLLSCSEYAIIPHTADDSCRPVILADKALGICTCTNTLYSVYANKSLDSLSSVNLLFLLLLNPNTTSFWNQRRRLVQAEKIEPPYELWLTQLILGTHPRSNETIFHRQWVVQNYFSDDEPTLLGEFDICERIADAYRMHYGLWQYRRFLLNLCGSRIYQSELERMENWLPNHPVDSSGWSYFSHVLQLLVEDAASSGYSSVKPILQRQIARTITASELYPERECLWMFKRHLLCLWTQVEPQSCVPDGLITDRSLLDKVLHCFTAGQPVLFNSVMHFVDWCRSNNIGCPSSSPAPLKWEVILLLRHMLWLVQNRFKFRLS